MRVSPIETSANVATVLFLVRSGELTFSVPLTFRRGPDTRENASVEPIGTLGDVWIWDATDDVDGQRALLGLLTAGRSDDEGGLQLTSYPVRGEIPAVSASHQLTSEQSNTSIIYRFVDPDDGAAGVILKIFRVLSDGANPDVELQQALDAAGSRSVPRQYGSVRGAWNGLDGDRLETDILVAQEFLVGAADAWQVITKRLEEGNLDVGDEIIALGALTADIHRELAKAFPTSPATDEARDALVAEWHERASRALVDAPDLADHREAIEQVFDRARGVEWPHLQRVHGDYHLGQVLHVPDRGWVALDFEGEPLRPLAQRVQPDLALRDVAGMLRSFDYAAGSSSMNGGDTEALTDWTTRAQAAFMDGYGALTDEESVLLSALILDKALYEVSYEVASRPDWVQIPVRGVLQLFERSK